MVGECSSPSSVTRRDGSLLKTATIWGAGTVVINDAGRRQSYAFTSFCVRMFVCMCFSARACGCEWEYVVYACVTRRERGKMSVRCVIRNETIKVEKLWCMSGLCAYVCLTTSLGKLCRSSKGLSSVLVSTFRMTTSSSDRPRTLWKGKWVKVLDN